MLLNKAIESLEEEIVSLKEQTAREIKDIYAYLSRARARIKLRPRIVRYKGYSTFGIIWRKVFYYDWTKHRALNFQDIRKGRGHLVPKSRLLSRCRNCESWELEYIWEKEQLFAGVRRKVALLSQGVSALKQYCALEPAVALEPSDSADTCMEMQKFVTTLAGAFKSLKERIRPEVAEVSSRLNGVGIKPRVGTGKGAGFTVEWFKPNGSDPETGQSIERRIPREGKYSMRRSRLLAHCRDCGEMEREYIWEKELEFARIRKQVDLLIQAIMALKQYAKEALNEGDENV